MAWSDPIRILHLSDVHFRVGTAWDADPVLRALARFIKGEVEGGLVPDLVVFTGDLAFSGKKEEYKLARDWLEQQLWPALGSLPRDRLLLIPGNHDVDRGKISKGATNNQDGLLRARSQDEVAMLLKDRDDRAIMMKRHAAYLTFAKDWCGVPQPQTWWQRVIEIKGRHLHVAGLNSAWLCAGDEDRGRLLLGRYQLIQTVETAEAEAADWRIVLTHHPWDYLAEFDYHDRRAQIHQHADLLLRGHLHHPQSERILPPDPIRQCLELAAGCLYDGSGYPNAFQWIELSPEGKQVRVHYRLWQRNAWNVDRNQLGCQGGMSHATFDLARPEAPSRASDPAAPAIPSTYLAWLRDHHSTVELLGQDIRQGHAVQLRQIYVPAVTEPAAEAPAPQRGSKRRDKTAVPTLIEGERPPVLLLQRLDQASLFVPAPAGAGKSTFCRWAVLQSLPGTDLAHPVPPPEGYAEPLPAELRKRLPVLVPLREFARWIDCTESCQELKRGKLEEALAGWIDHDPPPGLNGALLRAHLATGSAFLLLDGLDEVPVSEPRDGRTVYPRKLILSGLRDALPAWERAGNRTLLTSRPYGLDEAGLTQLGLQSAPIEPLPRPLQSLFIDRWFHTLAKPVLAEQLDTVIDDRDDLAPLVENPLLLTTVCVLYDNGGRLPEDRYQLYQSLINVVLTSRYPGDVHQREPVRRRLEAIAHGMHIGEDAARKTPAAEASWREIERHLGRFANLNPAYEHGQVEPAVRREELLHRSGLLVPWPGERAAFYHLSFQEFLAAERMARSGHDLEAIIRQWLPVPEWRPTLLFLFAGQLDQRDPQWGLDLLTRLIDGMGVHACKDNPAPLLFIAEALDLCLAKAYSIPDQLAEPFRQLALGAIEHEFELRDRQALALTLGRIGDRRHLDLRDAAAYVEIPAGCYPFGKDRVPITIATPFRLGRYPVTNRQYQAFIEEGGYANSRWWSAAGWAWRQAEDIAEPRSWRDRPFNAPNQPVVGVSFWEAEACARWAGGRLPTEQEWEAAAAGKTGRTYPWGDDWQDGICNSEEARLSVTSPVGMFPRARSPEGLDDLAGNVFEWCASFGMEAYNAEETERSRMLRGGSWLDDLDFACCAFRGWSYPDDRFDCVGFRVVCSSPI